MARKPRNYAAEYAKLKARAKAEGLSVGKFKKRRASANAARKAYRDQGRRYFDPAGSAASTRDVLMSAAELYQKERSARLAGWPDNKRNEYLRHLREHVVMTGEYTKEEALERYSDR